MKRPYRLMHGDCLRMMGRIESGSIELILADLPYGTTACEWDRVIPFEPLWSHYRRLLSPRGSVVLTGRQPFTSNLVASNLRWFKYSLVWEKSNGSGFFDAKHRPLAAHEDIAVFSPAGCSNGSKSPMVYNPQMGKGKPLKLISCRDREIGEAASRSRTKRVAYDNRTGDRYPRSVLYFASDLSGLHPTRKPVGLMDYLIRTYSDPGAIVLDNVMGSGPTGEACAGSGRRFIGIEGRRDYFELASERIESAFRSARQTAA